MTDRPIIFSAAMVNALLSGRKTMTRRLAASPLRRVVPGDRLWVRETWQLHSLATDVGTVVYRASINGSWTEAHQLVPAQLLMGKRLQPKPFQEGWRSPLHLFRECSRLTLEVTGIKQERLHDISEADATAEGCKAVRDSCHVFEGTGYDKAGLCHSAASTAFSILWDEINGPGAWDANPEVIAISFKVIKRNIDVVSETIENAA